MSSFILYLNTIHSILMTEPQTRAAFQFFSSHINQSFGIDRDRSSGAFGLGVLLMSVTNPVRDHVPARSTPSLVAASGFLFLPSPQNEKFLFNLDLNRLWAAAAGQLIKNHYKVKF